MGDSQQGQVSRNLWARGGKRLSDFALALGLVVALSPVLALAALLVKLSSRGPVFFFQERGGRHGRVFGVHKFRTMRAGRCFDPNELTPLEHPDVTGVGRVLRRLKVDELPQLLNVLKGDMSLVGPRPTLPEQVEAYDEFRRQRLLVRPGITGLAQVHGNTSICWDQRILYDIAYVRRCSLGLDLAIAFRTLLVVVLGEQQAVRRFQESRYALYVTPPTDYESETPDQASPSV